MRIRQTDRISPLFRAEIPNIENPFFVISIHLPHKHFHIHNEIPILPEETDLSSRVDFLPNFLSGSTLAPHAILDAMMPSRRDVSIIPTSPMGHFPEIKAALRKSLALSVPTSKIPPSASITTTFHLRYDITARNALKLPQLRSWGKHFHLFSLVNLSRNNAHLTFVGHLRMRKFLRAKLSMGDV